MISQELGVRCKPQQMSSHVDMEEKHVITDKSLSQQQQQQQQQEEEDYSRPSSSVHEDVHHHPEPETSTSQDKEAQTDAHSTLATETAIPPPPDGGLHAWLKVFGGFMIYINIWYISPPYHLPSTQISSS
jgi:hypothetical protein